MEQLFKKHFWIVHVALLAVVAVLCARTANEVAGHFLAQALAQDGDADGNKRIAANTGEKRNFAEASEYNIFLAKREVVNPVAVATVPACKSDADCADGEVCKAVEEPAPGEPAMQCQAEAEKGKVDFANAVPSDLPLKLVGTSVFSYPEDSLASIVDGTEGRKADAGLYSINECVTRAPPPAAPADAPIGTAGEEQAVEQQLSATPDPCNELMDVHTLLRIDVDRIYIQNNEENRTEFITLEEQPELKKLARKKPRKRKPRKRSRGDDDELGKGISKVGPNSYEVKQDEVDKALGNLSQIATKARIVPAFEGGQSVGFKLFSIRPGSIYSKIGIQNGDIIQKVNGYEISSPDKALEVYQKLMDGKEFSVDIKRRGKPVTLEYAITP